MTDRNQRLAAVGGLVLLTAWLMAGRPPDDTAWWDAIFDLGHMALFAVATALVLVLCRRPASSRSERASISLTVAVIGGGAVLSELAQLPDPTRHASMGDVGRDLFGAAVYLTARAVTARQTWGRLPATWAIVTASIVVAGIVPLVQLDALYRERDDAFPTVLAFRDSGWERAFVLTSAVEPAACDAGQPVPASWCTDLVPLTFFPDQFAGYEVQEVAPDWSGYDYLTMCIGVPADASPIGLTIRLQDVTLARLGRQGPERTLPVMAGMNALSIPLSAFVRRDGSRLRLDQMRRLAVFVRHATRPTVLLLAAVRLTRQSGRTCTHDGDFSG